jgi:uncharacterized membrane protein YoaT (DUF817 family)
MPANRYLSRTRNENIPFRAPLLELIIVVCLVIYAVAAIVLQWDAPWLLALLLLPAPVILIFRLGPLALPMAAVGAVVGPAAEICCVAGGLWSYADTGGLPLIPPWLITIWSCFPTALWLIAKSFIGEIPMARSGTLSLALAGIAIEVLLFVGLGGNTILSIVASMPLAMAIVYARPERSMLILMASGSILGPACESFPVAVGAWSYANAEILGMPAWLPLAYAMFAALVAHAALSFAQDM